jgi:trk system potassium uptake protein TrkH
MRHPYHRINSILHYIGGLLQFLALVMLFPLIAVIRYWQVWGEGWDTVGAFVIPSLASLLLGTLLKRAFRDSPLDATGSLLVCALSWIVVAALGAVPFVLGTRANYLDAYFEAISGFTTTGFTVFTGLDSMPRSILLWRSLTQWLGGIGILSFFLLASLSGTGAHHIYRAESHKIASSRPVPSMMNTVKILWIIYAGLTLLAGVMFVLEGMDPFDGLCHALTVVSTGGFSPHDSSIAFYRLNNHTHFKLIEYTTVFFMLLGGINFLVHYRVLTRDVRALWDNAEIRYWWGLLSMFTGIIALEHLYRSGALFSLGPNGMSQIEEVLRTTLFQVVSILTSTGFSTQDIGSDYFGTGAKQLFLVMMVVGGCVGSTSGGLKILRVVILNRLMLGEVFRARTPARALTGIVIDGKRVPDREVQRVAGLFFGWIALVVIGGVATALTTDHDTMASFSCMVSALGNTGPCYISVSDMVQISLAGKITYIVGMLAGRLEILPILLLFSRKAWR